MSIVPEAEFERLPNGSRFNVDPVRYDGEIYYVLTFRLTMRDREVGEPAADHSVRFVVDGPSARQIAHGLARCIEDLERL